MINATPRSYCYAQLPPSGLGNRLLIWARAFLFARMNQLPLLVSPWSHLHLRRILQRDPDHRRYGDYFLSPSPLSFGERWRVLHFSPRVVEPALELLENSAQNAPTLYVFDRMPHWSDYFEGLKTERETLRAAILTMLNPLYREQIEALKPPTIGVHVRMGDFRPLQPGEDFAKVGHVRTPLDYYRAMIEGIREIQGSQLPVTLFSDGVDEELEPLLQLPGVHRAPFSPAIVDLLSLSRSRVVVATPGSTFSFWAGFLADAPLLIHPDHIHAPIRSDEINTRFFEGGVRGPALDWPALLQRNIIDLKVCE